MKVNGHLSYYVKLNANIPDKGILGLVDVDQILNKAQVMIAPILHNAITGIIFKLRVVGVSIDIVESRVEFQKDE